MATGIEIAGLALAIFPITVKGLRWMVDGVETIKYWRRYRRKLEDYACDLEAARVYYLDTLEELLMGIVISDDEMSILVEDPGGNAWNKPEYEQNLRRRLDRSYDPYLQILLRMQKALTELRDKLGFDEYGKVLWDDYPAMYREMKRLKLTLSNNLYQKLLDQINRANKDLRDFTHQNIYLEPVRIQRRSKRLVEDLKLIRGHAASLHRALMIGASFKCRCQFLHFAGLRLEARPGANHPSNIGESPHSRFQLVFWSASARNDDHMKRTCQEFEIVSLVESDDTTAGQQLDQTIQSPKSKSTARTVSFAPTINATTQAATTAGIRADVAHKCTVDLCNKNLPPLDPRKSIGFLADRENRIHKHHFYRTGTFYSYPSYSRSLRETLGGVEDGNLGHLPPLSRGHRVSVAVILASSVLQLDGSLWLESNWTSKDIRFLWRPPKRGSDEPEAGVDFRYIYLPWKQCANDDRMTPVTGSTTVRTQMIRNTSLFALGLTLVELCFGKTLADMRTGEDNDTNETAIRLLNMVYDEMGGQYGDVVRRCLFPPFDVRELRLDNEEVQQKVFNDILTPLTQILKAFGGSTGASVQ